MAEFAPIKYRSARRHAGRYDYHTKVLELSRNKWRSKRSCRNFGGGINAFSRYENGKTKPPLALVRLLKVLERHPELLNEVRSA